MKNKKGFTLIEVLIGAGVLVVGALIFSTLATHTVRFQKTSREHSELIRENDAIKKILEATSSDIALYWMCSDPCHQADAGGYPSISATPTPCGGGALNSDAGGGFKVLHPYVSLDSKKRCILTTGIPPISDLDRSKWRLLANRIAAWSLGSRFQGREFGTLLRDNFEGPSTPVNNQIKTLVVNSTCTNCHDGTVHSPTVFPGVDPALKNTLERTDFRIYESLLNGPSLLPVPVPSPIRAPYPLAAPFYLASRLGQKVPMIFLEQQPGGGFVNTMRVENFFPNSGSDINNLSSGRVVRSEIRFSFQSLAAADSTSGLSNVIQFNIHTFQYSWTPSIPNPNPVDATPSPDPVPAPYDSEGIIH